VKTCVLDILIGRLLAYRYNNLFVGRALSGHIDMRLGFVLTSIDDLLELIYFLILKSCEHLFDLESVHHGIRTLRFGRSLGI